MSTGNHHEPPRASRPTHAWTQDYLDELPLWTLVQAFHSAAARLYALFARYDLTPTQFGVLAQLAVGAVESQAELARRVLVTPQSLHALVGELAARGLLKVSGPGGRGRRRSLELTQAGWDLISEVRPVLDTANRPANLGLDAEACNQLNRSLRALRERLESDT